MSKQAPMDFQYDVFVFYISHDKTWVRGPLLQTLEAAGLSTFIDCRNFDIGAPSVTGMERGVLTSRQPSLRRLNQSLTGLTQRRCHLSW